MERLSAGPSRRERRKPHRPVDKPRCRPARLDAASTPAPLNARSWIELATPTGFGPTPLALRCFEQRVPHRRGHFNRHKSIRRKQVVLAAFVDDSEITVSLSRFVRQYGVNLVALKRRLVTIVAHTNDKLA